MLALDVPLLSSLPGAPVTIHLDFDGVSAFVFDNNADPKLWASGPMAGDSDPIPAFSIDADLLNYSNAEISAISQIWQHVSEKFSPFNINVTTIAPTDYFDGAAVHAIIGGSKNDWYNKNVSGVAWRDAFTNERPNSAFTFSGDLITAGSTMLSDGDRYQIAETVAHEVGHTFGLKHQSTVDGANNVIVEYSTGNSQAAPIMGAGGTVSQRGVWWWGPSSSKDNNGNITFQGIQDDLATLTRPGNFINYRSDDFGDFGGAGTLVVNSQDGSATAQGVLETNGDRDAFVFTAIGPFLEFTVNNATLFRMAPAANAPFGMLAPDLELIPLGGSAAGNVTVTRTNNSAKLSATNVTPGGGYLLRVKPQSVSGGGQYDSLGQYTISGTTGAFAGLAGGVLTVNGYTTSNDLAISYISSTDMIVVQDDVFGGAAIQQFPRSQVTSIVVKFNNDQTDSIDIFGQYSVLNIPIDVQVEDGDKLGLQGTSGDDTMELYATNLARLNNTLIEISPALLNVLAEIRMSGFDGDDQFLITTTYHPVTIIGNDGDDTITLGTGLNDFATITAPISAFGGSGSDTLNMGFGNADAIAADVTFDGGSGGAYIDTIDYNDGAKISTVEYTVEYDPFSVSPNTVTRHGSVGPRTLIYSNLDAIEFFAGGGNDYFTVGSNVAEIVRCYGNSGNDSITFGDGLLGPLSSHVFNGGLGTDTLTFDDHNNPNSIIWDVRTDQVVYGQAIVFMTGGFEGVRIFSGNGADLLQMSPAIYSQAITLDGGGGIDQVSINGARMTSLTVRGGNDSAVDLLDIDDRNLPGNVSGGDVYANRISRDMGLETSDVFYSGFSNVTWYQQQKQNAIRVLGVSSDISSNYQFSIIGNSLNDYVDVYARDAMGNPTINGNLRFEGGGDVDQLRLIAGNVPANYRFYKAEFDSTSEYIDGAGSGWISVSPTVEDMTTIGSPGDDTFAVEQFISGAALAIFSGAGDDRCTIGNGDMSLNLTNAAAFTFDGGDDSDRFTIANGATDDAWSYVVRDGSVVADISGVYSWTSMTLNIESQYLFAGSADDFFVMFAVANGVLTECHGGGGYDGMGLGFSLIDVTLDSIRGPVVFHAETGGGRLYVDDADDTTGDVVHLTDGTLGAFGGDTLFGPGGSLTFSSLANSGSLTGFTLNLGSGDDEIYGRPLASSRVEINAGGPTDPPGDRLHLALAAVQNPIVVGGSSGSLTSSNLQTLSWTGIEQPVGSDNTAPQLVLASYGETTGSILAFQFSEDVSQSLNVNQLLLINTTTGQIVPANVTSVSYDQATDTARFTFPGLPGGFLPGGDYSATISSSVADAFGNPLGATSPFTFTVAARAFWIGAGNGLWNDPENWAGGQVPGVDDAVVIDNPNAHVTITVPIGSFAVASLLSYESMLISAGATFVVGGNVELRNATLTNFGSLQIASLDAETAIYLIEATLANQPGGRLGWGNPGNPLGSLNVSGQGYFINDGLVFVHTGSFKMAIAGTSTGTFEVVDGAAISFSKNYILDQGTTFNGGGLIQMQSPIDPAQVIGDVTLDGVVMEVSGRVDLAGGKFFLESGATLNNLPTGTLNVPSFPQGFGSGVSGQGYFINDGLLFVHTGSFGITVAGSSTGGTFFVDAGAALQFDGGYALREGSSLTGDGMVLVQPLVPPNPSMPPNPVMVEGNVNATNLTVGGAGGLNVTGSLSVANPLNVLATGLLTGTGTIVGSVLNGGLMLPGSSPGTLTISGNFVQAAGGILRIELGGSATGQFDQLRVLGTVSLGGTLEVAFANGFVSTAGNRFEIIDNNLTDSIAGVFTGLPEGSILNVSGRKLHLSYVGETGNDVLLTDATTAALIPDCCQPGKQALLVLGTSVRDMIDVKPVGGSGSVEVTMNGLSQGVFSPSGRIIVKAGAGNDVVKVADGISRTTWLYGEAGKDNLKGGAGPDLLMGGSGDDTLNGGNGRDLLIGGFGADRLVGGGADDVLIAGKTSFDCNEIALFGLMAEWNSSRSYTARIANLRGTGSGTDFTNRLNGNYFLTNAGPSPTVVDDAAADVLTGGGGFDWYLIDLDRTNPDSITDLISAERVDDVD